MTSTLLPRPKLQQAKARPVAPVRVTPAPVKPQPIDPFIHNRLELKPLLGQKVIILGVVQRHSFRDTRSFVCFESVQYVGLDQLHLPTSQWDAQVLPHAWCETTDHAFVPVEGLSINCLAEVISYRRRDGSVSYGLKVIPSFAVMHFIGLTCEHIIQCLEDHAYAGSIQALVQKNFDEMIADIRRGQDSDTNGYIICGNVGTKKIVAHLQKILRKMLKYLKRGRLEEALHYMHSFVEYMHSHDDTHFDNPVAVS